MDDHRILLRVHVSHCASCFVRFIFQTHRLWIASYADVPQVHEIHECQQVFHATRMDIRQWSYVECVRSHDASRSSILSVRCAQFQFSRLLSHVHTWHVQIHRSGWCRDQSGSGTCTAAQNENFTRHFVDFLLHIFGDGRVYRAEFLRVYWCAAKGLTIWSACQILTLTIAHVCVWVCAQWWVMYEPTERNRYVFCCCCTFNFIDVPSYFCWVIFCCCCVCVWR